MDFMEGFPNLGKKKWSLWLCMDIPDKEHFDLDTSIIVQKVVKIFLGHIHKLDRIPWRIVIEKDTIFTVMLGRNY